MSIKASVQGKCRTIILTDTRGPTAALPNVAATPHATVKAPTICPMTNEAISILPVCGSAKSWNAASAIPNTK